MGIGSRFQGETPVTVGQLIEFLAQLDPNYPLYETEFTEDASPSMLNTATLVEATLRVTIKSYFTRNNTPAAGAEDETVSGLSDGSVLYLPPNTQE